MLTDNTLDSNLLCVCYLSHIHMLQMIQIAVQGVCSMFGTVLALLQKTAMCLVSSISMQSSYTHAPTSHAAGRPTAVLVCGPTAHVTAHLTAGRLASLLHEGGR